MKNYVNLLVNKSNVKSSKNVYYARVQSKGRISQEKLLEIVKQKAPYLDITILEATFDVLESSLLELIESGYTVDLFGLGSLKLESKGSLKVKEHMQNALDGTFKKRDEGSTYSNCEKKAEARLEASVVPHSEEATSEAPDFSTIANENIQGGYEKELNSIAKKSVEFKVQFIPSKSVREHIKKTVEPSKISVKVQKPKIKSIEKVYEEDGNGIPTIIKIKGDDLKIVGESASLCIKTHDEFIQIPKEAIIQNEPKTLIFILSGTVFPLKEGGAYSIHLATQYANMGNRETSIIRRLVKDFSFEKMGRLQGGLQAKMAS